VTDAAVTVDAAMPKLLPDNPENYLALLEQTEAIGSIFIEAVIDEIEIRGGVDTFLGTVGITTQQLEVLRSQARRG
jgi:hypothetical protein